MYLEVLRNNKGDGALGVFVWHGMEEPQVLQSKGPLQVQDCMEELVAELDSRGGGVAVCDLRHPSDMVPCASNLEGVCVCRSFSV